MEESISEKLKEINETFFSLDVTLWDIAKSLRIIAERPPIWKEPIKKEK